MKKQIAIIIAGCLILSGVARAETCANGNGILATGRDGTTKFCFSRVNMNWWSAFTWCEKAGGTVLDVNTDCICTVSGCPDDTNGCKNLQFTKPTGVQSNNLWTRNEYVNNTANAYQVYQPTDSNSNNPASINLTAKINVQTAVCRMN